MLKLTGVLMTQWPSLVTLPAESLKQLTNGFLINGACEPHMLACAYDLGIQGPRQEDPEFRTILH